MKRYFKKRLPVVPFFTGLITLISSVPAHAIPILSENAAQNVAAPLTLYPDSEDKTLFYYMPNTSGFQFEASTNLPMIGFTYWGLGEGKPLSDAGAYLTWTSHLFSDKSQQAALDNFIKLGNKVAVLPLLSSTVNLTTTKGESATPLGKLFDEFTFSSHGGMAEDDIGVNAILTGTGAKAFRVAIENPDLMKTDYCFKAEGLGPEMKGDVVIHYSQVYDDFQLHASVNHWWVKASFDKEVEKLVQNGSIIINVTGGDAKFKEYIRDVADRIAQKLFVSDLPNSPTSSSDISGWSFAKLAIKDTHREEIKDDHFSYSERDLTTREFCIPITMAGLKPYIKDIIKNADAKNDGGN